MTEFERVSYDLREKIGRALCESQRMLLHLSCAIMGLIMWSLFLIGHVCLVCVLGRLVGKNKLIHTKREEKKMICVMVGLDYVFKLH